MIAIYISVKGNAKLHLTYVQSLNSILNFFLFASTSIMKCIGKSPLKPQYYKVLYLKSSNRTRKEVDMSVQTHVFDSHGVQSFLCC